MKIKELKLTKKEFINKTINLSGWVRFNRVSKNIGFIELFDGSIVEGIQLVYKSETDAYTQLSKLNLYSGVSIEGKVVEGKKNEIEIIISKVIKIFNCVQQLDMGKKGHSLEFLREIPHLRVKTKLFQSVMKIRSLTTQLINSFFLSKDFLYIHSPIITANDAEGAGESFYVKADKNKSFWTKEGTLSVSGQLHAEAYAQAFKNVYTFGPTFRAENSNTQKHVNEFWMLEPEMTFCDYNCSMDLGEELLKYLSKKIIELAKNELDFLVKYHGKDIPSLLNEIATKKIPRISYREAIGILSNALKNGVNFENKNITFGIDLATEHERFLAESHFKSAVYVYDYPAKIKSFYMYKNDDETVRGFDLLVPGIGELIGGSQREEDYSKLMKALEEKNISDNELEWYINLRRQGYVTSSGFGLGLGRLVMLLTGMDNIRDVLPFPRTPGNLKF